MNTLTQALLHFLWEGAVAALFLSLVLHVLRPASARLRYGAACATLFAMAGAFLITLIRLWPATPILPATTPLAFESVPLIRDGAPVAAWGDDAHLWWLAPLWMLGASLFLLRSLAGWIAVRRLRTRAICAVSDHWQRRIRDLASALRVMRPVVLLESGLAQVPVVLGFWRPVILFPARLLAGFPPEQIEYFLLHELAHVRRWDYLVNLVQTLVEDLLFYHPAVWWVSSVIRAERENCCDDLAAAQGNPKDLAHALAALEERRWEQLALAVTGGRLAGRIRRLLGQSDTRPAGIVPVILAAVLCASIALAFGTGQRPQEVMQLPQLKAPQPPPLIAQAQSAPALPEPQTPAVAIPDPYRRWLDEEAVYIIQPEERAAFERLRTDDERKQFIEQFWLRRDPTPGTPKNEMQEEHYRRIQYANTRFGFQGVSGWRSGRGQVYIKYGPPDELERHPETRTETWLYRYIQGIGVDVLIEFEDPDGTGEYRWKSDPDHDFPPITLPANPPAAAGTLPIRGGIDDRVRPFPPRK